MFRVFIPNLNRWIENIPVTEALVYKEEGYLVERSGIDLDVLVDLVVEQIKNDFELGDVTAIEELLRRVPMDALVGYLPEKTWENSNE